MKLENLRSLALLIAEHTLYLTLIYIVLFLISNTLIRKKSTKGTFLQVTILGSLTVVTYLCLTKIHISQLGSEFWTLFLYGNLLALLAEVCLYSYKLSVSRLEFDKHLWLAWWYHNMTFSRAIAETIAYGVAITTPLAYYVSGGVFWVTVIISVLFIGLHFLRRKYPISTFFPGWHAWMK